MTNLLCVYHRDCADGFASAWAVHRRFGAAVDYVAAGYEDKHLFTITVATHDTEGPGGFCRTCLRALALDGGRDVLIVDFSYPREVLAAMAQEARSVLVLDHHKTAAQALAGLATPTDTFGLWFSEGIPENHVPGNLAALFDMNRSGAGITWDHLHHGVPRPRLIDLVEDRDLWRFKHDPETRQFHAAAASYGYGTNIGGLGEAFARWDDWHRCSLTDGADHLAWEGALREGAAIIRAQDQLVDGIIRGTRRTIRIAGHVVPVACCPGALSSEAGNRLCSTPLPHDLWKTDDEDRPEKICDRNGEVILDFCKRCGCAEIAIKHGRPCHLPLFTATYYDGADGQRHFSLRSPAGGADVGAVAARYGGGGHEHASGFVVPIGWEGDPV